MSRQSQLAEVRSRLAGQTPESPFSVAATLASGETVGQVAWELAIAQFSRRSEQTKNRIESRRQTRQKMIAELSKCPPKMPPVKEDARPE